MRCYTWFPEVLWGSFSGIAPIEKSCVMVVLSVHVYRKNLMGISNEHYVEKPGPDLLLHTFNVYNAWVKASNGTVIYWNNTLGFAPETVATMADAPTLDLTGFPRIQKLVDDWALVCSRTAKATETRRLNDGCIPVKVSVRVPAHLEQKYRSLSASERGEMVKMYFEWKTKTFEEIKMSNSNKSWFKVVRQVLDSEKIMHIDRRFTIEKRDGVKCIAILEDGKTTYFTFIEALSFLAGHEF
jgi:hypothetical protein